MKELQKEFQGIGEMRDYYFRQIKESETAYIYELTNEFGDKHYEVFLRRVNTQFNCISYPTSKAFGIWAWCIPDLGRSLKKWATC